MASESDVEITGYHAHLYSTAADDVDADLRRLHAEAPDGLPGLRIGRLREAPVGPHPRPMFQVAAEPEQLQQLVAWVIARRGARSVLVHPLHGDALREHSVDAMWLGERLELVLAIFEGGSGDDDGNQGR